MTTDVWVESIVISAGISTHPGLGISVLWNMDPLLLGQVAHLKDSEKQVCTLMGWEYRGDEEWEELPAF